MRPYLPLTRRAALLLAAGLSGLLLPGASHAHDFKLGGLSIDHPWARATPPGATVAGGYMTIVNGGGEADRLVSVTTPAAGRAELHEMTMENGVARMRPLADGLPLPAGATVELKPGSYHLMMMDLSAPLKAGESVPATLTFEKAGAIDVTLTVEPLGSEAPEGDDHGMDTGGAHHHMESMGQ